MVTPSHASQIAALNAATVQLHSTMDARFRLLGLFYFTALGVLLMSV